MDGEKSRGRGGHADEHARSGGGAHKKPVEQKACHADRRNGDGIGQKGFSSSAHRDVVGEECNERRSAQGIGQCEKEGEPRAPKEEGADQATETLHAARPDLGWDLGETGGTIGVRMPNQSALLRLLQDVGPMAVTSANLTGQPPATSVEQAVGYFGTRVSAYLDGGPTQGSTASSIVDFAHDAPRALRLGTIPLDDLSAAAGVPIAPVEGAAS